MPTCTTASLTGRWPKRGDMIRIETDIAGLNEYGEGIFRGKTETVKIPRAFPGDRVRVCFDPDGKPFVSGRLERLLRPSPDRVAPDCAAHAAGCGGCPWLGLDYARQLEWKQRILADVLARRAGLAVEVLPTLGMAPGPEALAGAGLDGTSGTGAADARLPDAGGPGPAGSGAAGTQLAGAGSAGRPLGYRNKMSLVNAAGRMAFLKDHSEEPVFPALCGVATPPIARVWQAIRDWELPPEILQVHLRSGGAEVGVDFFVKRLTQPVHELAGRLMQLPGVAGVGASSYRSHEHLTGRDHVEEAVAGWRYRIPLNGFFQTNTTMAEALLRLVLARLGSGESLLDLYCGGGFFTIPAARQFGRVLGVENNAGSIAAAGQNWRLNQSAGTEKTGPTGRNRLRPLEPEFRCADVAQALASLKPGAWQTMLLDPPRSGCGEAVVRQILRLAPRRIVYVSCSPESLARDLKALAGHYRVVFCQPVDLFPHTFHMEAVVVLEPGRQTFSRPEQGVHPGRRDAPPASPGRPDRPDRPARDLSRERSRGPSCPGNGSGPASGRPQAARHQDQAKHQTKHQAGFPRGRRTRQGEGGPVSPE